MSNNAHVRFGQVIMTVGILIFFAGLIVDSHLIGEAIVFLLAGAAWQAYVPAISAVTRKVGELVWRNPFSVVMASGVTSWVGIIGWIADGPVWAWWFAGSMGLVSIGMTLEQIKNPASKRACAVNPGQAQPWTSAQPELTTEYQRLAELFEHHGMPDLAADMHGYADLFKFLEALTSAERPAVPEPVIVDPEPADEAPELTQQPYEPTEDEVVDAVFNRERIAEALREIAEETHGPFVMARDKVLPYESIGDPLVMARLAAKLGLPVGTVRMIFPRDRPGETVIEVTQPR